MTIFAEDLLRNLRNANAISNAFTEPAIDIGLTTAPYYTDKSAAIASEGSDVYTEKGLRHVHLLGFDTLTRFFAAKYYPDFDPPFRALDPFFDAGHRLRVTCRPSEEFGSVEEQEGWVKRLAAGELDKEGAKREWSEQIEMVEAANGEGVSSTKVRKAAKAGRWEEVERLCTEGIAAAVKEGGLYEGDDRGAKMA